MSLLSKLRRVLSPRRCQASRNSLDRAAIEKRARLEAELIEISRGMAGDPRALPAVVYGPGQVAAGGQRPIHS
jgi:hypothetical protein